MTDRLLWQNKEYLALEVYHSDCWSTADSVNIMRVASEKKET